MSLKGRRLDTPVSALEHGWRAGFEVYACLHVVARDGARCVGERGQRRKDRGVYGLGV